ncbi:MAG: hypothetical protein PUC42_11940 [Bacteroidales bacterium]|nr:hypothetical protein [Bacteroidales bacterium]
MLHVDINAGNIVFSISPRYKSKEESFDLVLVNSDVRLSAKGLTLNEEIELFDYDFVSLRNKLELLVSNKEDVVSWNTEEETLYFSITHKEQCFIWNLRYIIGGKEDDFLNFNFVLSETDMNSIISELYSIIDWVNMS